MNQLTQQIFAIDNSADMNLVIEAVKIQQKTIRAREIAMVKSMIKVGDTVSWTGKSGPTSGTVEKIKVKRAVVNVDGTRWDVPLSMLGAS